MGLYSIAVVTRWLKKSTLRVWEWMSACALQTQQQGSTFTFSRLYLQDMEQCSASNSSLCHTLILCRFYVAQPDSAILYPSEKKKVVLEEVIFVWESRVNDSILIMLTQFFCLVCISVILRHPLLVSSVSSPLIPPLFSVLALFIPVGWDDARFLSLPSLCIIDQRNLSRVNFVPHTRTHTDTHAGLNLLLVFSDLISVR